MPANYLCNRYKEATVVRLTNCLTSVSLAHRTSVLQSHHCIHILHLTTKNKN